MMEDNLWSLANVVTGFAIGQSITFLYALGKDLNFLQSMTKLNKLVLAAIIVLFSIFYILAILRLTTLATYLPSDHPAVWCEVSLGRIVAILLFAVLAGVGLFMPEFLPKIGPQPRASKSKEEELQAGDPPIV